MDDSDTQHIRLQPFDVMTVKGRLALAHRILDLNEDDSTCRGCIGGVIDILHGPVPGAALN